MDTNFPNIGTPVETLPYWGPTETLEEGGIVVPDLFTFTAKREIGCQSETCRHHSHGAYAPEGELLPVTEMVFLGVEWTNEGWTDHPSLEYFQLGDRFIQVRREAHKHTRIEEICEEEVPASLWDGARLRAEEEAIYEEQRVHQVAQASLRRAARVR